MRNWRIFLTATIATLLLVIAGAISREARLGGSVRAEARSSDDGPAPVEDSMHEFMEYVFQPTYKRLKSGMAKDPKDDNQAWKALKSDALILAEAANLVLIREPEDEGRDWRLHSLKVRQSGADLYQAAGRKDFSAAGERYRVMLSHCNRCHRQFADGKYQLTP